MFLGFLSNPRSDLPPAFCSPAYVAGLVWNGDSVIFWKVSFSYLNNRFERIDFVFSGTSNRLVLFLVRGNMSPQLENQLLHSHLQSGTTVY